MADDFEPKSPFGKSIFDDDFDDFPPLPKPRRYTDPDYGKPRDLDVVSGVAPAWTSQKKNEGGWSNSKASCYHTHPTVAIFNGVFIGGSCSNHHSHTADVYVALDSGSLPKMGDRSKLPQSVSYPITNMHPPSNAASFKVLIGLLVDALKAGKTVHVGCIGGHGRTGLVLAALLASEGSTDPIGDARSRYCKKAVESRAQVAFLVKHYGAKPSEKGSYEIR